MKRKCRLKEDIFKSYLIRDLCAEYIKYTQNSVIRKKLIITWAKDLIRGLTKENIRMANKHREDAQHHESLGKFKLKAQ